MSRGMRCSGAGCSAYVCLSVWRTGSAPLKRSGVETGECRELTFKENAAMGDGDGKNEGVSSRMGCASE